MNLYKITGILLALTMLTACSATVSEEKENTGPTVYTASGENEHGITADGATEVYKNIKVEKTGDGNGENADFYGENAAVFATNGADLTIENADVTTDGKYANGVFAYGEGTKITISNSAVVTSQRNSGGIMVAGGGELYANDLTIQTEGGSSAAIRSDRGGGTMVVDGGTYTANGSGSPAIYSTASVSVRKAKLQSGSAQGIVVEGGNSVELTDCQVVANNTVQNSDKSDYYQAVMLYQSMSGDAGGGDGFFRMSGGSLTSQNGGMFFVTNATYAIELENVALTYADDDLLRICAAGWGNSGKNGGQVQFTATEQNLNGTITIDEISGLNLYLKNGTTFVGSFENNGYAYVELADGAKWTLTADCAIQGLTCEKDSIDLNGHTLTVDGKPYVQGDSSTGETAEFAESEGPGESFTEQFSEQPSGDENRQLPEKTANDENGQPTEKPSGDEGSQPPEKPADDENGQPPEKPADDENGQPPEKPADEGNGQPPEKPADEGNGQPPEKPADEGNGQPPEKPADDENGRSLEKSEATNS